MSTPKFQQEFNFFLKYKSIMQQYHSTSLKGTKMTKKKFTYTKHLRCTIFYFFTYELYWFPSPRMTMIEHLPSILKTQNLFHLWQNSRPSILIAKLKIKYNSSCMNSMYFRKYYEFWVEAILDRMIIVSFSNHW